MRNIRLTDSTIATRMNRLVRNEDFRIYQGLLVKERIRLIEYGKKVKTSEAWAAIEGFDMAAMAAEKWANKAIRSETKDSLSPTEEE